MFRFRIAIFFVFFLFGVTLAGTMSRAMTLQEKTEIQAAMQRHVDNSLVDGVVLYLDPESRQVQALYPVTAHPMILMMDTYFVLCFDFRDDKGAAIPVDYYMAKDGDRYVVFHSAINDRALLHQLMDDGRVERVR